MKRFQPIRSGDEPMHARSPLRLRLVLAAFGLACAIAGVVLFAILGSVGFIVLFAVIGAIAVVDTAIIVRHIREGEDFQPGPEVRPHRPDLPSTAEESAVAPVGAHVRHRRYTAAAVAALFVIVNAWTWVWMLSFVWAWVLSLLAAALILGGVIASSADSPIVRGGAPDRVPWARVGRDQPTYRRAPDRR
ncbi:MAG TPA: DUF6343 family protein [Thermoleophilia bacterium]|nr:DUF6343 family protein [Thermoleophilia bacterium]